MRSNKKNRKNESAEWKRRKAEIAGTRRSFLIIENQTKIQKQIDTILLQVSAIKQHAVCPCSTLVLNLELPHPATTTMVDLLVNTALLYLQGCDKYQAPHIGNETGNCRKILRMFLTS